MIRNFFITSWRNLVKNKSYASLNILGLVIGVVVCLLISVWLQRELSFDNFHPHGKAIFRISNSFKSESETFSQAPSGFALGAQLPRQLPLIKAACRVLTFEYKFKVDDRAFFESNTYIADSNFFSFFGFRLIEGQAKKVLNAPNQLVLSALLMA
jgi:putative ABC transport system permease protein